MTIHKGDDTNAFDTKFISVVLENSDLLDISKAEFRCGTVLKTFEDPIFPLDIDLTSEETSKLDYQNVCYLAIYDRQGRKKTCEGYLTFTAKGRAV